MKHASLLVLALMLTACGAATGYMNTYGDGGGGGHTNTTPPWFVTYKNTTPGTTGTVPAEMSYNDGDPVTVVGNTGNLSWYPYHWVAWNTMDKGGLLGGGGGMDYFQNDSFNIHSNIVLYGRWVHN